MFECSSTTLSGGSHSSTKIFLELVAINSILFINNFIRRSPAHGAQWSLVVMKVSGLALRGQEVAHRSKKRTTTWAK